MSTSFLEARRKRLSLGKLGAWIFLGAMLFISLFPVFWMLRTALSPNMNLFSSQLDLFPDGMSLNNFKRILGFATLEEAQAMGGSGASLNFLVYLWNSLKFTGAIVFGTVTFAVFAGYALAQTELPWSQCHLLYLDVWTTSSKHVCHYSQLHSYLEIEFAQHPLLGQSSHLYLAHPLPSSLCANSLSLSLKRLRRPQSLMDLAYSADFEEL